ncbi:hypothetical protein GCM10012280_66160 [Wenjunlia tyrosinilytica]|uniref:Uncharacterized protein n=1 Tax=Wenjunlia tyrosinilytica TaxID=1544741 RepID=A0A918E2H0_9ACTN|nr:hypothetical protein GCM10012280_66160 [Wenjunlia tyrosinilytica]
MTEGSAAYECKHTLGKAHAQKVPEAGSLGPRSQKVGARPRTEPSDHAYRWWVPTVLGADARRASAGRSKHQP